MLRVYHGNTVKSKCTALKRFCALSIPSIPTPTPSPWHLNLNFLRRCHRIKSKYVDISDWLLHFVMCIWHPSASFHGLVISIHCGKIPSYLDVPQFICISTEEYLRGIQVWEILHKAATNAHFRLLCGDKFSTHLDKAKECSSEHYDKSV